MKYVLATGVVIGLPLAVLAATLASDGCRQQEFFAISGAQELSKQVVTEG